MENTWWQTHKPTKRRIIQLYSALLYNAHLRGFAEGKIFTGKAKAVCVPGFNCYSCPGAVGACPLGSIQNALGSLNKSIGFYVLGIVLLYGMLLGRTVCGWICPLGLIQELLHKIPTPKLRKSKFTRILSYLKYVILAIFVIAIPVYYGIGQGIPVPGFCKYICPAGTFEGAMGMLPKNLPFLSMLGPLFTRKFIIMVIVGLACIFCYRSFCRFLCPLGAIYGMFSRLAVIGVRVDTGKCNNCGACVRNCKMDVSFVGDHECIHCGKCIADCHKSAISLKAGNFTLIPSRDGDKEKDAFKRKKVLNVCLILALILLCGLIVWCNFLDPTVRGNAETVSTEENFDETEIYEDEYSEEEYYDEVYADGEYIDDDYSDEIYADDEYIDDDYSDEVYADGEYSDEVYSDATDSDYGDGQSDQQEYESDAPIGYEVGNQLENFEINCIDGSTFNLADNRGKVVIINLWATYCGPCVQELPHFNELYHEHEGDVEVLAVHAAFTTEDVSTYIQEKGWDIPFAIDESDEKIFKIVNGSTALPQTIVLNRKGEVIFNRVGSVTKELLDKLYEQASE